MKKFSFLLLFLFISANCYADQLAWITKEQADKTIEYFQEEEIDQVVLWCACCDNDTKVKVNVSYIYYQKTTEPNYYEVWIKGKTADGRKIEQPVDLAYVHILRGSKWRCLGKELKFECDPCTKSFKF